MFTQMYFFEGHGLKCFDLLSKQKEITGDWIYLWKVDWQCKNANAVYFQPKVHAEHILITTKDRTDAEALKLIKEVQAKVNSTNFGALAQQYSEDSGSAPLGGDLGWFGKGDMVQEFEDAAYALKVGQVSEPIKTQYGYHLIKLLGKE
jgi:parvulin-like peptidyl-prolyl isomerase